MHTYERIFKYIYSYVYIYINTYLFYTCTHIEQVKAEKIDTLKRTRELEERLAGNFEPRINPNYPLREVCIIIYESAT